MRYDRRLDRFVHDVVYSPRHAPGRGMAKFIMDEVELGGRAAHAIMDPEQAWWALDEADLRRGEFSR